MLVKSDTCLASNICNSHMIINIWNLHLASNICNSITNACKKSFFVNTPIQYWNRVYFPILIPIRFRQSFQLCSNLLREFDKRSNTMKRDCVIWNIIQTLCLCENTMRFSRDLQTKIIAKRYLVLLMFSIVFSQSEQLGKHLIISIGGGTDFPPQKFGCDMDAWPSIDHWPSIELPFILSSWLNVKYNIRSRFIGTFNLIVT